MPDRPDPGDRRAPAPRGGLVASLLIAIAVSLLAKTFAVEAFVIPTGSMAPSLVGDHITLRSDETGYAWDVTPWHFADRGERIPLQVQGGDRHSDPLGVDPMTASLPEPRTGYRVGGQPHLLRAGDRILVDKLAYLFRPPRRFDVAVFKSPADPQQNFIKRIVALPGEDVRIVDGDIFARPAAIGEEPPGPWHICRKPHTAQRTLWQTVFSSEFLPDAVLAGESPHWWQTPWTGEGWTILDRAYLYRESGIAELRWDDVAWPITDWTPYNNEPSLRRRIERFPVGDVRVRSIVHPLGTSGLQRLEIEIITRGQAFRATLAEDTAVLERRIIGEQTWEPLDSERLPFRMPRRTPFAIEFVHCDQRLTLHLDGRLVAEADDDQSLAERLAAVTADDQPEALPLEHPSAYAMGNTSVVWRFADAPVRLTRLALDRDVYYQPTGRRAGTNHASVPSDHYFALGDNSGNSEDSRDWRAVDPDVRDRLGTSQAGMIHRDLLIGQAAAVYFPAPRTEGPIPMFDLGAVRVIR